MEPWEKDALFLRLKELDAQNRTVIVLLNRLLKSIRMSQAASLRRERAFQKELQRAIAVIVSPEIDPRTIKDFVFNVTKK